MPFIKVIARNPPSGEIVRVIRNEAEEQQYNALPPLPDVQPTLDIDIEANPVLGELADGNNWHRYRWLDGNLTRDGSVWTIVPDHANEAERKQLPPLLTQLEAYLGLALLTDTATAAERLQRINQNTQAIKALLRIVRYVIKNKLELVG